MTELRLSACPDPACPHATASADLLEAATRVFRLAPKRVPLDLAEALIDLRDAISGLGGWEC